MGDLIETSEDLVKKINKRLNGLTGETDDKLLKVIAVAYAIIEHFLGRTFFDRYIALSDSPDPFMMNTLDDGKADDRRFYEARVCDLADYLYQLQNERGFELLLERFSSNRDMRSVNLEAMIASGHKEHNFSIEILPLTGIRGQDFDFQASRGSEIINVEVTGLTNERFSVGNIRNVLQSKRDQLPSTHAAFLYCIIPQQWIEYDPDLISELQIATNDFFRRSKTKRINAIVHVIHGMIRLGDGAAFAEVHIPIFNPAPRFTVDTSSMFNKDESEIRRRQFANVLADHTKEVPLQLETLSY